MYVVRANASSPVRTNGTGLLLPGRGFGSGRFNGLSSAVRACFNAHFCQTVPSETLPFAPTSAYKISY